jgi:hypothetical protein
LPDKRIVIPYKPRDVFQSFHSRQQRFAVGVAHRRCGKTVAVLNDKIRRAIRSPLEHYRAAYVAPYLKQGKDIAWEYLKRYSRQLVSRPPNESELWVELLNGARIRIYGADNAEALRGGYLDDVTLDEYADMSPLVWPSIIRPMLADRRGTGTFIGTPKGRNAFFDIYADAKTQPDEWFHFFLPANLTGILPASELEAARRTMTPEQYAQEFECSFDAAIVGAYYGKELAEAENLGRICQVDYNPDLPVHTAWDLGIGDSTAIWFFQVHGSEIRVIDWYENHGQGLPHYAAVLKAKEYKYDTDWVPHDARVKELGTGRTRVETMLNLGMKPRVVPMHGIMDGINAARMTIPRCWFDESRCRDGVEALKQYQTEFDEKTRAFRDTPKHDWTSHTADAWRYLSMAWREITAESKPKDPYAELLRPRTIAEIVGSIGEYEDAD